MTLMQRLRKLNKGGRCYVQLRNRIDYEFFDVFFVERKTKRAEFENLLELPKMDEIPDFYGVWNAVLEKHKNDPGMWFILEKIGEFIIEGRETFPLELLQDYTCIIRKEDDTLIIRHPGKLWKGLRKYLTRKEASGRSSVWVLNWNR